MPIEIPLPAKISTNEALRMYYKKRNTIVHEFHKAMLPYRGIKLATPAHLHFRFEFKSRMLDCTNVSFMVKCLEDGMVHAGMLPDDTPKYVCDVTTSVRKGKSDRVIIQTL